MLDNDLLVSDELCNELFPLHCHVCSLLRRSFIVFRLTGATL